MRSRIAAWAACSVFAACAIAACGGSSDNGVASKSPDAIVSAALGAFNGVKSAHISGTGSGASGPVTLDLDLVSGQGGRGQMSEGGLRFNIEVIGNEVYLSGSPAFWHRFGGTAAARLFQGKWLKAPATGQFATLAQLSNLHGLLGSLSTHGSLVKTGSATVRGQSVVGVIDPLHGGTLYVATSGKPYPIEVIKGGGAGGRIYLSHFDAPVSLTPPAGAIDISKFK